MKQPENFVYSTGEDVEIGDIIAGDNNGYGITDSNMTKAVVTGFMKNGDIMITIQDHKTMRNYIGEEFPVSPKFFKLLKREISTDVDEQPFSSSLPNITFEELLSTIGGAV